MRKGGREDVKGEEWKMMEGKGRRRGNIGRERERALFFNVRILFCVANLRLVNMLSMESYGVTDYRPL